MSEITSRAAYLRGLADGLKLDTESNEGKLLDAIISVIHDMAEEISMLDDEQGAIVDQIDELDEVVHLLGDSIFGDDEEDDDYYRIRCENCGEEIEVTSEDLDDIAEGKFHCPSCDELIEIDFSGCDCGCDDCGCDD